MSYCILYISSLHLLQLEASASQRSSCLVATSAQYANWRRWKVRSCDRFFARTPIMKNAWMLTCWRKGSHAWMTSSAQFVFKLRAIYKLWLSVNLHHPCLRTAMAMLDTSWMAMSPRSWTHPPSLQEHHVTWRVRLKPHHHPSLTMAGATLIRTRVSSN